MKSRSNKSKTSKKRSVKYNKSCKKCRKSEKKTVNKKTRKNTKRQRKHIKKGGRLWPFKKSKTVKFRAASTKAEKKVSEFCKKAEQNKAFEKREQVLSMQVPYECDDPRLSGYAYCIDEHTKKINEGFDYWSGEDSGDAPCGSGYYNYQKLSAIEN